MIHDDTTATFSSKLDSPEPEPRRSRGRPVGDRDGQRTKLLMAGMSVIAELGYAGASLRTVAQRAGFTTGAVTYYFKNKDAMLIAIAEHMFDEFDALLRPARRAADIREAFELWLDRMATDSELWLVQFELLAHARQEPECAEVFQRRYARYREAFASVIRLYQKAGTVRTDVPADMLADQLSALADGWTMMLRVEPKRFEPSRMEALLRSLVTLLAPTPAARA